MGSLSQKIEKAYTKWEEREKKVGVTSQTHKVLYSEMAKIKKNFSDFAKEFEGIVEKGPEAVAEHIEAMYNGLKDVIEKIPEPEKIFSDFSGIKDDESFDYIKGSVSKSLNTLKEDVKESDLVLLDFLEIETQKLKFSQKYKQRDNDENALIFVKGFLCDVFVSIAKKIRVTEKIIVDDSEYFNDASNSNIASKALRLLFPRLWSTAQNQLRSKHMVETVSKDIKIFPAGEPLVNEVKQGGIGDCYLMATLIALAKKNPKAITKCFVQGLDKIENEKNIDIRLYYVEDAAPGETMVLKPIIITVDKTKVLVPKAIKGGALWPRLIEKAYAVYRKKRLAQGETNEKLDGGSDEMVMMAITGKIAKTAMRYKYKKTKRKVFEVIKNKFDKNKAITCTFKKKIKIKDVKSGEKCQIVDDHVYAIVGIDMQKEYIRLINPWKSGLVGGRKAKNSPKSREGGHIAMSFDDFEKNYHTLSHTTNRNV